MRLSCNEIIRSAGPRPKLNVQVQGVCLCPRIPPIPPNRWLTIRKRIAVCFVLGHWILHIVLACINIMYLLDIHTQELAFSYFCVDNLCYIGYLEWFGLVYISIFF